jgi:hypothetical protein
VRCHFRASGPSPTARSCISNSRDAHYVESDDAAPPGVRVFGVTPERGSLFLFSTGLVGFLTRCRRAAHKEAAPEFSSRGEVSAERHS